MLGIMVRDSTKWQAVLSTYSNHRTSSAHEITLRFDNVAVPGVAATPQRSGGDGRFCRQNKLFSTGGTEVARGSQVDFALNAGHFLMIEVQTIDDISELASYRLFWTSWLPETPRASFFHTLEWLETYWDHFGDDQKLRALVVRSAGKPIGIVPALHSLAAASIWRGPRARLSARRLGHVVRADRLKSCRHDARGNATPAARGSRLGFAGTALDQPALERRCAGRPLDARGRHVHRTANASNDFARRFRRRLGELSSRQVAKNSARNAARAAADV